MALFLEVYFMKAQLFLLSAGLFSVTAMAKNLEPVLIESVQSRADYMPPSRGGVSVIKVRVPSGGCTNSTSFQVNVDVVDNEQVLSLVRVRPDHCEAYFPNGVSIELYAAPLRHMPVKLANPLMVHISETH